MFNFFNPRLISCRWFIKRQRVIDIALECPTVTSRPNPLATIVTTSSYIKSCYIGLQPHNTSSNRIRGTRFVRWGGKRQESFLGCRLHFFCLVIEELSTTMKYFSDILLSHSVTWLDGDNLDLNSPNATHCQLLMFCLKKQTLDNSHHQLITDLTDISVRMCLYRT